MVQKHLNLKKSLSPAMRACLDKAEVVANWLGVNLYLVGGTVRDVKLGRSADQIKDLDLAVEGDAMAFARAISKDTGIPVKSTHPLFGTAVLEDPKGMRVDVATVRTESYDKPGALPRVSFGCMESDLYRRDFTINAMAVGLSPAGQWFDPLNGAGDLRQGLIRVLHEKSFEDDATRLLRAVRYEQRLGFSLEPRTLALFHKAVRGGLLKTISKFRLQNELRLIKGEAKEKSIVKRLRELGVWGNLVDLKVIETEEGRH